MVLILKRQIQTIPILEVVVEPLRHQALPLVVYYHGWRSTKELVLTQARKLADKGLRVILPDALNHGERLQPISPIPSWTFWQSIQTNLVEFSLIIDYFEQLALIENHQLGVGGVSMGGMTTTALLTQHPEIKVAACIMGSPTLQAYAGLVRSVAGQQYRLPTDLALLTSWLNHYDLAQQPAKIAGRPLLFWHGTADEKIPYTEVSQFYTRIQNEAYAQNVSFKTGEGQRHLVQPALMTQIADYFEQQFKAL